MKIIQLLIFYLCLAKGVLSAQSYFPPNNGYWDTISPQQLSWCEGEISSLDSILIAANTKSILILKGGKVAYEAYYNGFGPDSVWYWASAAKTLTASLFGIAQDEGLLSISDKSSDYLGRPWSSLPLNKQDLIRIENQLSMTTGLDYQVTNLDCKADSCLVYRTDAGSQWYYLNATYLLLHDVLEVASGLSLNQYTAQKYFSSIGLRGLWLDDIYVSNARAMARYGLLMLNYFTWAGQSILSDTVFIEQMKQSSQTINPAYGYLTWLNGKPNYRQSGLSSSFLGAIISAAPSDLYMAAGKNDQRIYMVPSLDIVVVRQGEAAGSSLLALSAFDNDLWTALMKVFCKPLGLEFKQTDGISFYPNPSDGILFLEGSWSEELILVDFTGREFKVLSKNKKVDVSHPPKGMYLLIDAKYGSEKRVLLRG